MNLKCPSCGKDVQTNWRFCRYCGIRLDFEKEPSSSIESTPDTEETIQILEKELGIKPDKEVIEEELDKEKYERIIFTRDRRRRLNEEKKELLSKIDELLEQVRAGLLKKDAVMSEIQKIKKRKEEIEKEEAEIGDLPETLPIEDLLDEEEEIKQKIRKLDLLKKDQSVSKETLLDTIQEYKEKLSSIRERKLKEQVKLQKWLAELKSELKNQRKQVEKLYVRFQLGELSKEKYEKEKTKLSKNLERKNELIIFLEELLKR